MDPRCLCRTTSRADLWFSKNLFIVRLEHFTDQNRFSTRQINLESSFEIHDSDGEKRHLLGFTVHDSERTHYIAYIFNYHNKKFIVVKMDDMRCVEVIQNPWVEIISIDLNADKRPAILVYGRYEDPVQQDNLEHFLIDLASKIDEHRFEQIPQSKKNHKYIKKGNSTKHSAGCDLSSKVDLTVESPYKLRSGYLYFFDISITNTFIYKFIICINI